MSFTHTFFNKDKSITAFSKADTETQSQYTNPIILYLLKSGTLKTTVTLGKEERLFDLHLPIELLNYWWLFVEVKT